MSGLNAARARGRDGDDQGSKQLKDEARGGCEAAQVQKFPGRGESLGPEAERADQSPRGVSHGGVVIHIATRRLSAALSLVSFSLSVTPWAEEKLLDLGIQRLCFLWRIRNPNSGRTPECPVRGSRTRSA